MTVLVYHVELTWSQLANASDMLRHDGAFRVRRIRGGVEIDTLSFTRARWESFGIRPEEPDTSELGESERARLSALAEGLANGLRLAYAAHRALRDDRTEGALPIEGDFA